MSAADYTVFPTLHEALYLHTRLIERFGGEPGVRDPGLLESALARPRSGYYDTLTLQAAALMQSLARNHAFVDGNKRMAFALTAVFLRTNGYALNCTADEGETFLVDRVLKQQAELDEMTAWLGGHLQPVNGKRAKEDGRLQKEDER